MSVLLTKTIFLEGDFFSVYLQLTCHSVFLNSFLGIFSFFLSICLSSVLPRNSELQRECSAWRFPVLWQQFLGNSLVSAPSFLPIWADTRLWSLLWMLSENDGFLHWAQVLVGVNPTGISVCYGLVHVSGSSSGWKFKM